MPAASQIIATNDGRFFRFVRAFTDVAFIGVEVKRTAGGFTDKKNAREFPVRLAASRVVKG